MQTRVKAVCVGIGAVLVSSLPAFKLFDWALIAYWEWQHQGRRMKITLWADDSAFILTLLLCTIGFYATVRYLQRHLPIDQRINRLSLVISVAFGMVVTYFAVVAYLWPCAVSPRDWRRLVKHPASFSIPERGGNGGATSRPDEVPDRFFRNFR